MLLQRREHKLSTAFATAASSITLLALALAALSCCASAPGSGGAAGTTITDYTGWLRSDAVAIGGETTGWILKRKGEPDLDVDIANIRTEAESLAGLLVRIRGRVQQRNYVERGKVPVLVAERIELAN